MIIVKLQVDFFMGKTGLVEDFNPVAEPLNGLIVCLDNLTSSSFPREDRGSYLK